MSNSKQPTLACLHHKQLSPASLITNPVYGRGPLFLLCRRRDSALGRTVRSKGWLVLALFRLRCLALPQAGQSEQCLLDFSGHYSVIHNVGPSPLRQFLGQLQVHIKAFSKDIHLRAPVAFHLLQAGLGPLPPSRRRVGVSESMRGKVGAPVSFTILLNALVTRSKFRVRGFLRPSMAQRNVS